MLKQKTLKGSFSLNGKGLHTGVNLTVTFNPAPDNHGYKIQRIDLEGQPIIDAVAENVGDTTRGTVLMKNGIKVRTVEHALAALYILCLVDLLLVQIIIDSLHGHRRFALRLAILLDLANNFSVQQIHVSHFFRGQIVKQFRKRGVGFLVLEGALCIYFCIVDFAIDKIF